MRPYRLNTESSFYEHLFVENKSDKKKIPSNILVIYLKNCMKSSLEESQRQ